MSAEPRQILLSLWEKLHLAEVKRTIAREPEDVIRMELMPVDPERPHRVASSLSGGEVIPSKRSEDVPEEDRWRLNVTWRHFYGFTTDGKYFAQKQHGVFDYELGLSPELSHEDGWLQGTGIYEFRPRTGVFIAGEVGNTRKGLRFTRWFRCSPQFRLMVELIREGKPVPVRELAEKLYVNGGGYGDTYWVFADLVLNDSIDQFVRALMEKEDRPPIPTTGLTTYFGWPEKPDSPMGIGQSCVTWLHELSYRLGADWWKRFLNETERLGLEHYHPQDGACCAACDFEQDNFKRPDRWNPDPLAYNYPYQRKGWRDRDPILDLLR